MNDEIRNLLEHQLTNPDQHVVRVAGHVLSYARAVERGELSESEFDELVQDVMDTAHIAKATNNIERAAKIEVAYDMIKAVLPQVISLATGK